MNSRKLISISGYNYTRLKTLGSAGDSFNDVLTQLLDTIRRQKENMGLLGEPGLDPRFTTKAIFNVGELDIDRR